MEPEEKERCGYSSTHMTYCTFCYPIIYVNFCVKSVVPTKTCQIFPNNKPWVSKHLESLLDRKKAVYDEGDRQASSDVQREINRQILVDKEAH